MEPRSRPSTATPPALPGPSVASAHTVGRSAARRACHGQVVGEERADPAVHALAPQHQQPANGPLDAEPAALGHAPRALVADARGPPGADQPDLAEAPVERQPERPGGDAAPARLRGQAEADLRPARLPQPQVHRAGEATVHLDRERGRPPLVPLARDQAQVVLRVLA